MENKYDVVNLYIKNVLASAFVWASKVYCKELILGLTFWT